MSKSSCLILFVFCLLSISTSQARYNFTAEGPQWGCGLVGPLPGINPDGSAAEGIQTVIDGLKVTSSDKLVSYWNWNLAPDRVAEGMEYLTKDFVFMPENWGVGTVAAEYVRTAGKRDFLDGQGNICPAKMAEIFLGANEPDISGSCMGDMMGRCTGSCTAGEVAMGCPTAHLSGTGAGTPLPNGHCDCWSDSHATGCGFWPVEGCTNNQPLPDLFNAPVNQQCVNSVIAQWRKTAAAVVAKGYKYLTAPLLAVSMDWQRSFVQAACTGCSDISCGCPTHVGWHFYATDCSPISTGGYDDFQNKLDQTKALMEEFPHLMGAIVNEVGMLNCRMDSPSGDCVPNDPAQHYPANQQVNEQCPKNSEMPDGFASFIDELMARVIASKTSDGRSVVKGFSWFNLDGAGGTYNLRLFNNDGTVNDVGRAYIKSCNKWAKHHFEERFLEV